MASDPKFFFSKHLGGSGTLGNRRFSVTPFSVRNVLLFNIGTNAVWELSGDISGGASGVAFDLLGSANSVFDFSGEQQTFSNSVDVRTGVTAVISGAGPDGEVWPNVNYIRLNSSRLSSGTTGLLLRGDFELNKRIDIIKPAWTTFFPPVRIGQINDGTTPFDAVFGDTIRVLEDSFQVLRLTADAGGSATFNEKISVAGGVYGFDKVGAGTVAVNHRVSQGFTNTLPIGTVNVEQGTLLVNSPAGNDSFYTTGIVVKEGATLGGTGQIVGNVTLAGTTVATLAPGNSIGTLSVDGDVVFGSHGRFLVEVGSGFADRLDVTGLLDLSGSNDVLEFQTVGGLGSIYVIADYGSVTGQFSTVVGLPDGYWLDYAYLGQNQIALVPEPGTCLMLTCLLAFGLLVRRRS